MGKKLKKSFYFIIHLNFVIIKKVIKMYKKINEIYKDIIIDPVKEFDNHNYYYFYKDNEYAELFGIKKVITDHERNLLKTIFVEKIHFDGNVELDFLFNYLFNKGKFPFLNKTKFLVFNVLEKDIQDAQSLLKDIYKDFLMINYHGLQIAFIHDLFEIDIKALFLSLSQDLNYLVHVHEGFFLNSSISGKEFLEYVDIYINSDLKHLDYSKFSSLFLDEEFTVKIKILNTISKSFSLDQELLLIFKSFVNNNFNVLKTAKVLYMNRITLTNKLDLIHRITNLAPQVAMDAMCLYLVLKK